MKIKKSHLQQIIKEELELSLKESIDDLNPAQALKNRIASHQKRTAGRVKTGREVSDELESRYKDDESQIQKVLDLLEDVLSEVEIDAGRGQRSRVDSSPSERDIEAAQTAQNYLPELQEAVEILRKIVESDLAAADMKAAEEILSTRMGSYRGTTLPGGRKIK